MCGDPASHPHPRPLSRAACTRREPAVGPCPASRLMPASVRRCGDAFAPTCFLARVLLGVPCGQKSGYFCLQFPQALHVVACPQLNFLAEVAQLSWTTSLDALALLRSIIDMGHSHFFSPLSLAVDYPSLLMAEFQFPLSPFRSHSSFNPTHASLLKPSATNH